MSLEAERIAIIGMAGRFPGARDLDHLWRNLCEGVESITRFSEEELIEAGVPAALLADPRYVRARGVLDDPDRFDAGLFGFTPREAELLDPQHRVFLECAWEALEHAGYGGRLSQLLVGVFAGAGINTYLLNQLHGGGTVDLLSPGGFQTFISSDKDFLATRVAYKLNLRGPALTVQTACSTSLVAVSLACQSLLGYQCDVALAGAVSIAVPQRAGYLYQEGMILSPDGHCRAFDAGAQGTVPGSGAGVVALKRLSDALADGDTIHAVIRGFAVNNDGAQKVGFTAPGVDGQAEVITMAQAFAGIDPRTIGYLEAHGTGTAMGDPIEIEALSQAFRAGTHDRGFCALGSVKTNLGHLDTAAGMAGLIKAVLAVKHGTMPPSLHFTAPNPRIDFASSPFYVNTTLRPWPAGKGPRRAGVSSFGIGGTNAHVVLEEAPAASTSADEPGEPAAPLFLPLSARGEGPLRALAGRYREMAATSATRPADLCYTAQVGRAHLPERAVVAGSSSQALGEALAALEAGEPHPRVVRGAVRQASRGVVFLFTGQGAQYPGMGRELYRTQPVFREALERCDALLQPLLGRSILDLIFGEGGAERLEETAITQPALFVIEVALLELWRSWGVEPAAVIGHSVGELVAAYAAGVVDLEAALRLVVERGRLMQALPRDGEMVAVAAEEEAVREALAGDLGRVSIAAFNGPADVVISGERVAVAAVVERLRARGVRCKALAVSHAFHSPLMEAMLEEFETYARSVRCGMPRIPLVSNLTGQLLSEAELAGGWAGYWRRHLCEPVRFYRGLETLVSLGFDRFLEIGPDPVLLGAGRRAFPDLEARWLPSMRRDRADLEQMLLSLGQLYVDGLEVAWSALHTGEIRRRVPAPTYPFERHRYWVERTRTASTGVAARGLDLHTSNPLLGNRLTLSVKQTVFESHLEQNTSPLLADHRYFDRVTVPAVAYLAMMWDAAEEALGARPAGLEAVTFARALVLEAGASRPVQTVVSPEGEGAGIEVSSLDPVTPEQSGATAFPGEPLPRPRDWSGHASARIAAPDASETTPGVADAGLWESESRAALEGRPARSGTELYAALQALEVQFGPSFRAIQSLSVGEGRSTGRLELQDDPRDYRLLPRLAEAALQLLSAAANPAVLEGTADTFHVPVAIDRFTFHGTPSGPCRGYARVAGPTGKRSEGFTGSVALFDEADRLILALEGVRYRAATRAALRGKPEVTTSRNLYTLTWQALPCASPDPGSLGAEPSGPSAPGLWGLLGDEALARALSARLEAGGERAVRLEDGPAALPLEVQMREAARETGLPWRRVVYLCGNVESNPVSSPWVEERPDSEHHARVLAVVRALARLREAELPRLWLVTSSACSVAGEPLRHLAQAPLWGLGRVIGIEHPELWGGLVDLEPGPPDEVAQPLLAAVQAADREDQTALRGGVRYGARLVPLHLGSGRRDLDRLPAFDPDATWLITGGLGGLGLELASWLAGRGIRSLVLLGRRRPGAAGLDRIAALERDGVRVWAVQADVADEAALAGVLAGIDASMPPLRGVIHAAGLLDDGVLLQIDRERFDRVMAPKVQGAWNLHRLSRERPLDAFILFSSAAALLGSPGQGNYAAGNAFLDALAAHRHAEGLPALSIAWGPWAEVGMAATGDGRERRRLEQGIGSIAPVDGIRALETLLAAGVVHAGVLPVDWPRYLEQVRRGERPPFLSAVAPPVARPVEPRKNGAGAVRRRLEAAAPRLRRELLGGFLREQVARVLGGDANAPLDPRQALQERGLDSLMAIELRDALGTGLELKLPATMLFDHPSIEALTTFLERELALTSEEAPKPGGTRKGGARDGWGAPDRTLESGDGRGASPPSQTEALDDLTEDELASLLDAKLAHLDAWMEEG